MHEIIYTLCIAYIFIGMVISEISYGDMIKHDNYDYLLTTILWPFVLIVGAITIFIVKRKRNYLDKN
jgi:cytochrome c-type biogenesis protein CcmH/NrfF